MKRLTVDDDIPALLRECEAAARDLYTTVYADPSEVPDRQRILRGALRFWLDDAIEQLADHEKVNAGPNG